MHKAPHLNVGCEGERMAVEHLIKKGYQLLAQNWRYKNHHEIDLVMKAPSQQLVAVEVRSHDTPQKYEPFESVERNKVRRLMRALVIFADQSNDRIPAMRIDVVSVVLQPLKIEHFEAVDLNL